MGLWLPGLALAAPQPDWTRVRLFEGGQIYVIPPESVRLEYNLQDQLNLDGTGITGFGSRIGGWATLPMRWQIGVQAETDQAGLIAPLILARESVTLDWAWAPWGHMWGNPVIGVGFLRGTNIAPEGWLRLTVGDAVWESWRAYGALQFGRELSGFAYQQMYQLRAGLAWQSEEIPITWSADAGIGIRDHVGNRFSPSEINFWLTPSFVWEPFAKLYIILALGLTMTTDRDNGTSTTAWTLTPEGFLGYHFE